MPRHRERRHLPYSAGQMYRLVADVPRYPEFLPWVVAIRVRSETTAEQVADMVVGFKALRERFTSRVVRTPETALHVDYLDGPLKYLRNDWRFEPDGPGGCIVDFEVDFAFKNRLFETLAGQFFEAALMKMINAFEARARDLYGAGVTATPPVGNNNSSAHSTA